MGRKQRKRERLWLAHSSAKGVAVVVVELRSTPPRYWEKVLRGVRESDLIAEAVELAFSVARELGLRDFDLLSPTRLVQGDFHWLPEFGVVRSRPMARKNRAQARNRAQRRLRELVPPPARVEKTYSLADNGIDLEIAWLSEEPQEDGVEIWDDEGFSSWLRP